MTSAHLTIDPHFTVGAINRRVFGSFVEHLGRCVYDGIYEPGHPTADAEGFRQDVIELVKELGVSTIRYPGGNFVSGFRWEDAVGPKAERPRRLDLAWHSTETNEIGLHEFSSWLEKVDSELMLAVNLGTRGTLEALDLLEYANIAGGTRALASAHRQRQDRRRSASRCGASATRWTARGSSATARPTTTASSPRRPRRRCASSTRRSSSSSCGSSSAHMPTFGEWERVVLTHTLRRRRLHLVPRLLRGEERRPRLLPRLGGRHGPLHRDRRRDGRPRRRPSSAATKTIDISFDEWNVWYLDRYHGVDKIEGIDNWPVAPRLLEDVYSVADAVVFGNLMISLLKHADRVTSASLAQLVNVIAPIMTEPGGPAWRQTTFFPFAITSRLAKGSALEVKLESPTYETEVYGVVPQVDAVATHDAETGESAVFLVNRSRTEATTVTIDVSALGGVRVLQRRHARRRRRVREEHARRARARRAAAPTRRRAHRRGHAHDRAAAGVVDRRLPRRMSRGARPSSMAARPASFRPVSRLVAFALAVTAVVALAGCATGGARELTGDLMTHDPALAVEDGTSYVYSTGNATMADGNIQIRSSADGRNWQYRGEVWDEKPEWLGQAVPGVSNLWAPELVEHDGTWYLYYSASTFGSNVSVIALATNETLDPESPDYEWVDQGQVLASTKADDFNAIDPGIVLDEAGDPWMSFGSFWSGIRMIPLEWPSGGPADASEPLRLADRQSPPNAIEAPYIVRHDGDYFLFVSRDACCRGLDSTYNIAVGRSDDVGRTVRGPRRRAAPRGRRHARAGGRG